jgi:hypothetical protein
MEDEAHGGWHFTLQTDENILYVRTLVLSNWWITVWIIAEELSIALGGAHPIPKSDLKMR